MRHALILVAILWLPGAPLAEPAADPARAAEVEAEAEDAAEAEAPASEAPSAEAEDPAEAARRRAREAEDEAERARDEPRAPLGEDGYPLDEDSLVEVRGLVYEFFVEDDGEEKQLGIEATEGDYLVRGGRDAALAKQLGKTVVARGWLTTDEAGQTWFWVEEFELPK